MFINLQPDAVGIDLPFYRRQRRERNEIGYLDAPGLTEEGWRSR